MHLELDLVLIEASAEGEGSTHPGKKGNEIL